MMLLLAAAAAVLQAAAPAFGAETVYPLYKQCDPAWGGDEMGIAGAGERATVCKEGCAMASVAMALNGLGVYANNTRVTPGTLNHWLEATGGYACAGGDCNNLVLTAPSFEGLKGSPLRLVGEGPKAPADEISAGLSNGTMVYVAHVLGSSHFVLLTGTVGVGAGAGAPSNANPSAVFTANDPYFDTQEYAYANISDIITYQVVAHNAPKVYPAFDQCDDRWGALTMGTNNKTICEVGCLMTSITNSLAGFGVAVQGKPATPDQVDFFLQTHKGGFVPNSSSLDESVIPQIDPGRVSWPADGMHPHNDISYAQVCAYLQGPTPRVMIANVLHGGHFVLAVACDDSGQSQDTLWVHDSGFQRSTYSYSQDVVGWRIYDIKR